MLSRCAEEEGIRRKCFCASICTLDVHFVSAFIAPLILLASQSRALTWRRAYAVRAPCRDSIPATAGVLARGRVARASSSTASRARGQFPLGRNQGPPSRTPATARHGRASKRDISPCANSDSARPSHKHPASNVSDNGKGKLSIDGLEYQINEASSLRPRIAIRRFHHAYQFFGIVNWQDFRLPRMDIGTDKSKRTQIVVKVDWFDAVNFFEPDRNKFNNHREMLTVPLDQFATALQNERLGALRIHLDKVNAIDRASI